MVDYSKYKMSMSEAKTFVESVDNLDDAGFNLLIEQWASFGVPDDDYADLYSDIRSGVVESFRTAMNQSNNRIDYRLDLQVGLKLYELLNPQNGFDIIKASDDDVWRYLTIKVMPDITFIRYPNLPADVSQLEKYFPGLAYAGGITTEKDSARLKKKRFYSHTRRIWLKTLWWYIHLGWQGNLETTYEVLKNNTTNIISHFIERPGRGYRESLFRNMMYAYSLLPEQKNKIFMAAAKLNLAKCVSVEPVLTDGGELEYSKRLFEEVLSVPNLEMDEEQDVKDVEKNQNEATKAKVRKV